MDFHTIRSKYENYIIVLLTIAVNLILISCCFDFYYDLNDDVLMKNIMSGVYTGTPDGHNVQTLYILGLFISLFYMLCRSVPWYGLFLVLCQAGSLYLIGVRLLRFCKKRWSKAVAMLFLTLFLWGIILLHMVAIQYTITSGMLAAAAVFLFITTERGLSYKSFIIQNIPSIVLVILAYQLRTEMLLLVFPIICLAGLFCWLAEESYFQKENYIKYGTVFGCILLGMVLSRLIDFAAYGSEDWRSFLSFFNKRTEVYDYYGSYLADKEFMSSVGLGEAQQELFFNYNIGLDEGINEQLMSKIAAYASGDISDVAETAQHTGAQSQETFLQRLLKQGQEYIMRNLKGGDAPYNRLAVCGYLCVGLTGILSVLIDKPKKKRWLFLWELILLGVVRTCLWMFILMRGRTPNRITHPLYLVESMLLIGMLCMQLLQSSRRSVILIFYALLCIHFLPDSIPRTYNDNELRKEINQDFYAIAEYCQKHPQNYYFEDVFSIAPFSQEIFKNVDNSLSNYDFAGGWLCKSPLYREKLACFGIETMEKGLLAENSSYFIMISEGSMDWMANYYGEKGIKVSIEPIDIIGDNYVVYQVSQVNNP